MYFSHIGGRTKLFRFPNPDIALCKSLIIFILGKFISKSYNEDILAPFMRSERLRQACTHVQHAH